MRAKILAGVGLIALFGLQSPTYAGKITMSNPTSEKLSNGKTLCIYEDAIHSFQLVTKGKCPYAKTFDTDDSE